MTRTTLACTLAVALGVAAAPATAEEFKAGSLRIEQPWSRATPGGAKVAGGYMTITNTGTEPDRLVGGALPQAGRFEVHEMKTENGVMTMRPLAQGLEIKPGATVTLAPGGYHVMFMDLKEPLKQGETLAGELKFEKAGTVAVRYTVQAIGATTGTGTGGAPAAGGHQHH
ncbi:MAG: copper chaperone PCu(A)C [Rhodoplanes sp.]|uniref:copper chaperone PCu(A)C n=1 Tax=Rhodoplanes sp. TaxID=1968906 RepID=UPI00179A8716|nr:copper chaperone PCu(A)C [Rhodoplanes sp.]NVO17049.1 copper chaperone PCu(A)C [Rhodoplanes sp.]